MKTLHDKASEIQRFEGAERYVCSCTFLIVKVSLCSYTSRQNQKAQKFLLEQLNERFKLSHSPKRIKRKLVYCTCVIHWLVMLYVQGLSIATMKVEGDCFLIANQSEQRGPGQPARTPRIKHCGSR